MAKMIPKSNIPKQHTTPSGLVVRELSKEEALERFRQRREGKLPIPKSDNVELLPVDAPRIRKRHNVTMSPECAALARKLAEGNVSRGIERALLHYAECELARGKPGRKRNLT